MILLLQAATPQARTPLWPHLTSDISPDPGVDWRVLPNGMRYAMLANRHPAGVVSLRLSIEVGSLDEAESERGLVHFIEHMAFNGSRHLAEGEMVARLQRLGLAVGSDVNATTGQTFTTYAFDLPQGSDEAVRSGLFLLREIASELAFDPTAIDRERGVVQAELRRGDTAQRRSIDRQLEFLIPGALPARRAPLGLPGVIDRAAREQLTSLYDRFYRPAHATLVVVGDFDAAGMQLSIEKAFDGWRGRGESGRHPDVAYRLAPRQPEALSVTRADGGDAISVFSMAPFDRQRDTWDSRHEDMLISVGVAAVNLRLSELAHAENPVFRGASLTWSALPGEANYASGSVVVTPTGWKSGLEALETEWRRALTHGFTTEEIARQITLIRSALADLSEQAPTRGSQDLAASLVASLQGDSVFSSPADLRDHFETWAKSATPASVGAAFQRRMAITTPLIVMTSSVDRPDLERELVRAWSESAGKPVRPVVPKLPAVFAYTDFGPAGRVVRDERRGDLGARLITFDNNVRLNLKPTTFQAGSVLISLRVGEGAVALEHAPPGMSRLMSAYSAAGLDSLSYDDLQSALAGHSIQAGFASTIDAFGGVYSTTPRDLELQLQIAAAYMRHPGYRPEAEARWRQGIVLGRPGLDADARAVFASMGMRMLASGDTRLGASEDDGVVSRSFAELKAQLEPLLRDASIEVTIIGDFEEAAAIDAVAHTFGAFSERRRDPRPVRSETPVKFAAGKIRLTHRGEASQGLLKAYWPVEIDPDASPADIRKLSLLGSVLKLRLVAAVRETLGASYAPTAGFSYSSVYPGLNYIYAEIEARPEDLGRMQEELRSITAGLTAGEVSDDELTRTRGPILDQLSQHATDNGYWLSALAQAQGYPQQLQRADLSAIADDLGAVTVADLSKSAGRWLTDDNLRTVEIVPAVTSQRPQGQ